MGSRQNRRDLGLELISRANRWMVAGAVGLAAFLAYVADHSFKGHPINSSGTPVSSPASPASSSGGSSGGGLQQPSAPPGGGSAAAAAPVQPAPVVTGGS